MVKNALSKLRFRSIHGLFRRLPLRGAYTQGWTVRRNQQGGLRQTPNVPGAIQRRKSHSESAAALSPGEGTIYALSTGSGRAGIAIIRISGPGCLEIYSSLCPSKPLPKPRYASLRTLLDPTGSGVLDSDALVLYFQSPHTVTGEDVLELHIHGGPATVKSILSAIPRCSIKHNIRHAEPGEFTRRAFLNDRLDLAQVEALSDTLSAETEQQRRAAVRGNSGNLGRKYEKWREQLLYARGELEALIDFSEDQHFDESPAELMENVTRQVDIMLTSITQHQAASLRGELLKSGIRISLLGPPNAGKSSLLNQLVGREASIVSQEAGTTRDIVEVSLDMRGYLCTFADTAGLRSMVATSKVKEANSTIGAIEQEGIRRAKAKANASDVVIAMASVEQSGNGGEWLIQYDMETLRIASRAPQCMVVVNKCDSVTPEHLSRLIADFTTGTAGLFESSNPLTTISCRDAQMKTQDMDPGNIHGFGNQLVRLFEEMTSLPTGLEELLGVTERQRQLLAVCYEHLAAFTIEARPSDPNVEADIVIAAEHLRAAANALGRITGRGEAGDVEEVLGVVFEKFCVGK